MKMFGLTGTARHGMAWHGMAWAALLFVRFLLAIMKTTLRIHHLFKG
jgi:hypothetical protein